MTKIEDEFPSLKEIYRYAKSIEGGLGQGLQYETVQRYCLDKQRVREIIDKLSKWDGGDYKKINVIKLKKELGF